MEQTMGQKLTTQQAADIRGVSARNIVKLIKNKTLRAEKFGRDWLIDADDLAQLPKKLKPGPKPKNVKSE